MVWVATGRVAAEVVELKSVGDWTNEEFIDNAMNNTIPSFNPNLSIPSPGGPATMNPAAVLVDFDALGNAVKCGFHTMVEAKMVPNG